MEKELTTCERCGNVINYREAYVSITRSIEPAEYELATDLKSVQVIEATEIISLCGKCGNEFDVEALYKLIKSIPPIGSRNQN